MTERKEALLKAEMVLDLPYEDPDSDLSMLARQLLRREEQVVRLLVAIGAAFSLLSQHPRYEVPPIVVKDVADRLRDLYFKEAADRVIPEVPK